MSVLLAAGLAAAATGVALGLPRPGRLRLHGLAPSPRRTGPASSSPSVPPFAPTSAPLGAVLLAGGGALLLLGPVPALLAAAGAGAGRRAWRARQRSRARAAERAGAVEACSALAAELRAGRSPAEALLAAAELATGPLQEVLRASGRTAGLGGSVPAALAAGATEGGRAETAVPQVLRALAACWTVCAGSGSGLAEAVARIEEGLRAEQAARRAVDAELASPRATAALLALLPVFGLVLAQGLGADPLRVLLRTPAGLACLCLGLLLDGLGVWWTGRLVARAGGSG